MVLYVFFLYGILWKTVYFYHYLLWFDRFSQIWTNIERQPKSTDFYSEEDLIKSDWSVLLWDIFSTKMI